MWWWLYLIYPYVRISTKHIERRRQKGLFWTSEEKGKAIKKTQKLEEKKRRAEQKDKDMHMECENTMKEIEVQGATHMKKLGVGLLRNLISIVFGSKEDTKKLKKKEVLDVAMRLYSARVAEQSVDTDNQAITIVHWCDREVST